MNSNKKTTEALTGFRRFRILGTIALAAGIAAGIGAVVSAQIGTVGKDAGSQKQNSMTDKTGKNPDAAAPQADQINRQTRPLTPEEAQKLADGIKDLVNQSDEGLIEVQHPDGSVSVDLQGRFQNVVIAKKNSDGTVSDSCVDNTKSAASFLEISPKRFGDRSKAGSTSKQIERDSNGDEVK